MKLHLRWQILLAVLCILLVFSILSFQVQTASLCTTIVPAAGGVLAEGVVGAPQRLNPLLADGNPVERELNQLIFDGLTAVDESGQIVPALAESWSVSEDGRVVTFTLHDDIFWHDGEPVTADDVVYSYQLAQADNFSGAPALNALWQTVEISKLDEQTVSFALPEPYAPFLEATTLGILPAHILGDVSAAELVNHPFNSAPIGTGPWMVPEGQNWPSQNRLQLSPNPLYWREGTQIAALEFRFYPDDETLLAAFEIGEIQAINQVSADILPEVAGLPDSRLFTAVAPRSTMLLFNLSETGSDAVGTIEMRQAMAYALDRPSLIDNVLEGQAVPVDGPYLPSSWAYNPNQLTSYTFDPVTATARFDGQSWLLVEGQDVRQKDGNPLNVRLLTLAEEPYLSLAQEIQSQWADVNVRTTIETANSVAELIELLSLGEFDVALVDVSATIDPDLYDFWSQEAIVRGQNYAGWNNRRASEALEQGRQLWRVEERRPYYDTFLRLYNNNLPALTLFQHVTTYALDQDVNLAEIGQISSPRERYTTFAEWFLLYREVTISCAEETSLSETELE